MALHRESMHAFNHIVVVMPFSYFFLSTAIPFIFFYVICLFAGSLLEYHLRVHRLKNVAHISYETCPILDESLS